jgi:predicted transcriptional regulator
MIEEYRITNLIEDLKAEVLTEVFFDKTIKNGYCCDMLSWAMAKVTDGDCWFTILSSMNVIAVASLSDCPVVVLSEGTMMDADVLEKANAEEICVLKTSFTTFQAAGILSSALAARVEPYDPSM